MFQTTIVGNHPKISEANDRENLRRARNRFDAGKIDADELEAAVRDTIRGAVFDQANAGIDRVTDGRIRWDDPVTPLAAAHDGFEIGGLIRFFNNNMYYRRPIINKPIRFKNSAVVDDFKLAKTFSDRPMMASVCGPFSLAKFCVNEAYKSESALYKDCAALVAQEINALAAAGAEWVQLDEPFIGFCPDEIDTAVAAISDAARNTRMSTLVYVYFSPIQRVVNRLWDLPVTMIGADCVSVPGNLEALCSGPAGKARAFGLLDARNTRLETNDQLHRLMARIVDAGAEDWPACWLTPSAALEFLPHGRAVDKLNRLSNAVTTFSRAAVNQP